MKKNAIADELRVLYERDDGLNPEKVIEWAAKHPESALYSRFQWDDTQAAREYRLIQARHLITEVEVIYPDGKARQVYVSPFGDRGKKGYVALVDLLSDAGKKAQFLSQALDEYLRVGAKYSSLKELAGVREAVERVAASATATQKGRRKRAA